MTSALIPRSSLHESAHLLINLQSLLFFQCFSEQFLMLLQKLRISDILFQIPKPLIFLFLLTFFFLFIYRFLQPQLLTFDIKFWEDVIKKVVSRKLVIIYFITEKLVWFLGSHVCSIKLLKLNKHIFSVQSDK